MSKILEDYADREVRAEMTQAEYDKKFNRLADELEYITDEQEELIEKYEDSEDKKLLKEIEKLGKEGSRVDKQLQDLHKEAKKLKLKVKHSAYEGHFRSDDSDYEVRAKYETKEEYQDAYDNLVKEAERYKR